MKHLLPGLLLPLLLVFSALPAMAAADEEVCNIGLGPDSDVPNCLVLEEHAMGEDGVCSFQLKITNNCEEEIHIGFTCGEEEPLCDEEPLTLAPAGELELSLGEVEVGEVMASLSLDHLDDDGELLGSIDIARLGVPPFRTSELGDDVRDGGCSSTGSPGGSSPLLLLVALGTLVGLRRSVVSLPSFHYDA